MFLRVDEGFKEEQRRAWAQNNEAKGGTTLLSHKKGMSDRMSKVIARNAFEKYSNSVLLAAHRHKECFIKGVLSNPQVSWFP